MGRYTSTPDRSFPYGRISITSRGGWFNPGAAFGPLCWCCLVLLAMLLYRSPRTEPDWRLALQALILMMGASLAYAIGGGFSLEPRKEYPLLPLLLFFICSLMPVKPSRWAVAVLSVIGLVSTWLVIWTRDLSALEKIGVG